MFRNILLILITILCVYVFLCVYMLLFNHWALSNFLRTHELQNIRSPFPSFSPEVCSNSCPLSHCCHPTISSSVTSFSSCPQSFPASGSFIISWLFASGSQIIEASASASVLPVDIELISFRIDWFDLLALQGILKSLLQYHNSKASQETTCMLKKTQWLLSVLLNPSSHVPDTQWGQTGALVFGAKKDLSQGLSKESRQLVLK